MLHTKRVFSVADIEDATELARQLRDFSWCLCNGFRYRGVLWLNDSTSEDAIQEYAVIRERDMVQLESITVSWCSYESLERYIQQAAAGEMEVMFTGHYLLFYGPASSHEPCRYCR